MRELKLDIEGMSCAHCVASVRKALGSIAGVNVREVSIGNATVELDPAQADVATIIDAVQDAGYEAREAA